ncbi:MAG TPA: hypothetical protein VFJ57_02525 [Solirubrobacterales bacterium]|nr:hypothetical protein [Solirubrobacterales bacterium]
MTEIELTHKQLGEFAVSYGAGKIGENDVVFVATEDEETKRGLLHFPGTDT